MKSNIVRALALTLAIAGFGATTVSAHSASKAKLSSTTKMGPPMCLPGDPTMCGMVGY